MALVAGFTIRCRIFTIDRLGQYPGTGCFTHTTGATKQEGMGQLVVLNGIFQGGGNMLLSYNCIKSLGSVFSG